jgi:excisionase family DNA binding protein
MSDTSESSEWITVTQAALRLRVTDRTVRRWIELGYFPGTERTNPKRKGEYRIPAAAVSEFEQNRKL